MGWPAVRAGMLSQVELTGFPRLEVGISVVDRFASDGLRGCRVQIGRLLTTGLLADSAEFAFTASGVTRHWVVNLLDEADRAEIWNSPYVYRVIADFDPTSPLRPAGPPISPWRRRDVADLLVDPRNAYAVGDVTVTTAPMFSFQAFPQVTVDFTPGLETPNPSRAAQVSLTPRRLPSTGSSVPTPPLRPLRRRPHPRAASGFRRPRRRRRRPPTRSATATLCGPSKPLRTSELRATTGGPPTTGRWSPVATWRPTGSPVEPWLSLPDPLPEKLQVNFFVDLPWPDIAVALLQVQYVDEAAGVRTAVETVTLSAANPLITRLFSIAAGGFRGIAYRLTLKLAAGPLMVRRGPGGPPRTTGWSSTADWWTNVRSFRAVGGPLADRRLASAQVQLQVRGTTGQPLVDKTFSDGSWSGGQAGPHISTTCVGIRRTCRCSIRSARSTRTASGGSNPGAPAPPTCSSSTSVPSPSTG